MPSSWLNPRSRTPNEDKLPSDAGMEPVRLLFLRERILRLISLLPNSEGTLPLSWFKRMCITSRRVQELRLAGSGPEKSFPLKLRIWMWHRCMRCKPKDGMPPATHRVIMSDAAWGLSFGKFLELSFSNHMTANRIASCGHSLQRDCLRFYGYIAPFTFF